MKWYSFKLFRNGSKWIFSRFAAIFVLVLVSFSFSACHTHKLVWSDTNLILRYNRITKELEVVVNRQMQQYAMPSDSLSPTPIDSTSINHTRLQ